MDAEQTNAAAMTDAAEPAFVTPATAAAAGAEGAGEDSGVSDGGSDGGGDEETRTSAPPAAMQTAGTSTAVSRPIAQAQPSLQQLQQLQPQRGPAGDAAGVTVPAGVGAVGSTLGGGAAGAAAAAAAAPLTAGAASSTKKVRKPRDPAKANAARKRRKLEQQQQQQQAAEAGGHGMSIHNNSINPPHFGRQISQRGGGGGGGGGYGPSSSRQQLSSSLDGGAGFSGGGYGHAGGGGGNGGYLDPNVAASAYSSAGAMPFLSGGGAGGGTSGGWRTRAEQLQQQIVVLVPGSDTIKIGFSEAMRPKLFRTIVAYRVPDAVAAAEAAAAASAAAEGDDGPGGSGGGDERKDTPLPPLMTRGLSQSVAAAAAAASRTQQPSILTAGEQSDEDEMEAEAALLSTADRTLLLRWRRKREYDQVCAERQLKKLQARTAAAAANAAAAAASAAAAAAAKSAADAMSDTDNEHDNGTTGEDGGTENGDEDNDGNDGQDDTSSARGTKTAVTSAAPAVAVSTTPPVPPPSIRDPDQQIDLPAPPQTPVQRMSSLLRSEGTAAADAAASASVNAVMAAQQQQAAAASGNTNEATSLTGAPGLCAAPRAIFAPTLFPSSSSSSSTTAAAASAELNPTSFAHYVPRFPLSRGRFNVSARRSVQQVVHQLEDILRAALSNCLGLSDPRDLARCGCAVAVPDQWGRREVSEFVGLLLGRLGFREVFLQRESVLACYGAGLQSACVVDLGAHRSRVCCVEEGQVIPRSVMELNYGTRDIDALFAACVAAGDKTTSAQTAWGRAHAARLSARNQSQAELIALRLAERVRTWREQHAYCLRAGDDDEDDEATGATTVTAAGGNAVAALTFSPSASSALSAAASAIPIELDTAAALAPLGLFHPTLFPTHLTLRHAGVLKRELNASSGSMLASPAIANLDPLAALFLQRNHPTYFAATSEGQEKAARAAAAASATAAATATDPAAAADPRKFDKKILEEELVLPGMDGSEEQVGDVGGGAAGGTAAGGGTGRTRGRASGGRGARRGGVDQASSTNSATGGTAAAAVPPPFKLDRRRKDHQALLQFYTEEQLMAGVHLEPNAPHIRAQEEAAASAAAAATAATSGAATGTQQSQATATAGAPATVTLLPAGVPAPAASSSSAASAGATAAPASSAPSIVESFLSSRLPLHQAVAQSLKALVSVEAQSRMATSILLTGGGAHGLQRHDTAATSVAGAAAGAGKTAVAPASYVGSLADAFEERLIATVPYACPGVNTVHCLRPSSGTSEATSSSSYAFEGPLVQSNPQELAWRGAAILARAETTRDMWLSAEEWKRCGPKILREKLPFAW